MFVPCSASGSLSFGRLPRPSGMRAAGSVLAAGAAGWFPPHGSCRWFVLLLVDLVGCAPLFAFKVLFTFRGGRQGEREGGYVGVCFSRLPLTCVQLGT